MEKPVIAYKGNKGKLEKPVVKYKGTGTATPSPVQAKTVNPTATPIIKTPTMAQLQQQRQQAQVDMDMEAVNRLDAQMKQMRAQTGQQTLGDRIGSVLSGTTNTGWGQTVNAAGTLATGVDYNERQIKRLQETLANGYTSDEKLLTDAQRKGIEESIAKMQKENAEVMNDTNHAGNKLQQIADRMTQTGEQQIQEAKAGLGKGGQLAVDVAVGGLQLAGDIAANAVVPGAGLAMMGARSFGGAAQDARQAGATRDQQLLYGAGSAAASMLTEKIANVAGPFKKAFGGGAIDKLASKLTSSKAGKLILSSLSEGGEEALENALQPILQRLTYDPDAAYDEEWVAETAYSGLVGAILGGVGGSVDLIGGNDADPADVEWQKTLATVAPEKRNAFDHAKTVAERFGTTLNVGKIANGAAGEYLNGRITIDPNATDPVRQVLIHELTHHMETSGLYGDFSNRIMEYMKTDMNLDLDAMRQGIIADYAANGNNLDANGADRELVAKFAEDMLFQDEKTVMRLLETDRNLFQKIYDWIRDAVRKMKGTEQEAFLIEAQNLYEKALRKAGTQTGAQTAQNVFAGPNARTANLAALQTAQQMETQGANANAIRQETGWFRGMDGKWRYEISDEGMKYYRSGDAAFTQNHPEYAEYQELSNKMLYGTITPDEHARLLELGETWGKEPRRLQDRLSGGAARLQDIIRHNELFEAYPELRGVSVRFAPMGSDRGQYNRRTNTITLNESIKNAPENTIVHEVQHAIQEAEDFAGGASVDYWEDQLRNNERIESVGYQKAMQKLQAFTLNPENAEVIQLNWMLDNAETDEDYDAIYKAAEQKGLTDKLGEYSNLLWNVESMRSKVNNRVPSELYRNTAGEIEARNVAERRTWTRDQRRETMPELGNENTVFAGDVGWHRETEYDPEVASIKEQMLNSKQKLDEMDVVARATVPINLKKKDEAAKWVTNYLEQTGRGYRVDKLGFGEIYFSKKDIDKGLRYADTPAEKAALAVLPQVLKRGIYVGSHTEHKGRPKQTITFAAPVELNGIRGNMGVVVNKNGNHYYAHRILMPDGTEFVFADEKNNAAQELSRGVTVSGSLADTTSAAFNASIRAERQNVKDPYDIIPNLAEMAGQNSMGRSFKDLAGGQRYATQAEPEAMVQEKDPYDIIPNLAEMVKKPTTVDTLPTKEKGYVQRTENGMLKSLGKALEVPVGVQREDLKPMVRAMTEEYLATGNISQKTVDDLFERAYQEGIVVDTSYYDQHKDIKNMLRTQAVSISPEDAANIPGYGDFRKAAFNTVKITKDGTPVDVAYSQLSEMAPSLFPADITHPADQLVRMVDVGRSIQKVERTLNDYYGENAGDYKAWAKRDFLDSVENLKREMNLVQRTLKERAEKQAKELAKPEMLKAAFNGIKQAKRKVDRAVAKELLTDADRTQIDRLLKGEITLKDVDPRKYNVKGIKNVYEAKLEYEQMNRLIREYKKQHSQTLRDEADADLGNASGWKDKARGIAYSRETMERNIRDIAPDRETADRIIRKYFAPVHEKQAESTRAKTDYRNRVRQMNLSRKVADGNVVSEAHAVQLLGEAENNIQMLQESTESNAMRDGKTLQEWQTIVTNLWAQNPKLDRQKIANAVDEFRRIYDELFEQMNEVRVRNGYEPVAYRKGYFPHFQPGETGLLADFGKALGITTDVTNLPTSINGLTHTFRPGITYFGNAKERLGFNTAYDAVEGFDKYIEGAADVIYQTDNIQRLRALAAQMRYRTTDEGIKKQVDEIRADENLTEDQKDREVESLYKDGQYTLSNFVVELDEYTNLLANKKSRHDRNMEQAMGRKFYNTVKALESRVAANMVALNPTSWLTNFIPITQGAASLDTKALLKGMWDTLVDYKQHDGMTDVSTFLSNRKGSDPLVRTWAQKASAGLGKPMEYIDSFTAGTLVRARYNQNISKEMSAAEALYEADSWTAGVMADRSKGAMPTLFNRTNPLTKMFTQFQLEVNNQYSYLLKDVPDDLKKAWAVGMLKMFVGAWLYNEVYEHFIGRRPAMDPLGILNEAVGDLAGYELPNLIDMGAMAISGELNKEDLQTEAVGLGGAVKNAAGNVAEQLPFMSAWNLVGANIDAGRIPMSSAIPSIPNVWEAATNPDWAPEKRAMELQKELTKPITYMLSPFGGGLAKKVIQGTRAIVKGGSYKVDSQGNEILQYPVYMDPMDPVGNVLRGAQTTILGKSSLPTAQQWVESGFDSLNAKETAAYRGALEAGVSQKDAFELLQNMGKVKKTDTESAATLKRKMLRESNISPEGKSVIFYGTMANDKDMELMDAASERDVVGMAACLMDIKDAGIITGGGASKAKLQAIQKASMSGEGKTAVYLSIRPEKADELAEISEAGISIDTWLQFEAQTSGLSGDANGTKKEKVLQIINNLNITPEQKDALYYAADYSEKGIDETPWHADPYDLVGNIMRGTTLKMPTIKMPEIKIPTLKF